MSGDPNDMFSRMFASFVNRKNRGSSSSGPTPPPPPEPLHRTTSEHRSSSRSRPRGIAALLSPGAARTPTRSPFHSSSSNRNSGAAAAAAAAAANQLSGQSSSHQHASHQPGHGPPPSQGHRGYQDYEPGSYGRGSTRGGGLFSPLNRGSAGAGPSRRQTGKLSEKTASTDEDHPPRKRSRTHIVRSQSAHAGSLHGSSRSQDKSKTRFERRRRVSPAEASVDAIMPRASPTPPKTPAGGKSFPCPQCDSHFQQRGQLARHTRRVHEKLRPHACEHCGRLFGARSDRTRHIQVSLSARAAANHSLAPSDRFDWQTANRLFITRYATFRATSVFSSSRRKRISKLIFAPCIKVSGRIPVLSVGFRSVCAQTC